MKKILFFTVIGFALVSCVKDWKCECVGKSFVEAGDTTDVNYDYIVHFNKKDATTRCEQASKHHELADIDCALKTK